MKWITKRLSLVGALVDPLSVLLFTKFLHSTQNIFSFSIFSLIPFLRFLSLLILFSYLAHSFYNSDAHMI